MYNYKVSNRNISLNEVELITSSEIVLAINKFNEAIQEISKDTKKFDINIFETLGMRNLSGFVGEVFVSTLQDVVSDRFIKNPHQDGYPDLLLNNSVDKNRYLESSMTNVDGKWYPKSKELFSPYKFGGVEIKSTVGSIPPASSSQHKLGIGEQRVELLNGFDWKAHHRETNNLIGLLWDFIDEVPVIIACFYRNDLVEENWGRIVQPKSGGGRTTSVSIMNAKGVKKMCQGWIAVIDDTKYIEKLSNKKWIGESI